MSGSVVVLNDTRRDPLHIGCKAVMRNLFELCQRSGMEVVASFKSPKSYQTDDFAAALKKADAVIVNGEGTMHHDKKAAAQIVESVRLAKEAGKKAYLINSIWQDNPVLSGRLGLFDRIYVRESFSQKQVIGAGHNATVVPDLSFFGTDRHSDPRSDGKDLTFVDSVLSETSRFIAVAALRHDCDFFCMTDKAKRRLRNAVLRTRFRQNGRSFRILREEDLRGKVITGRFHAMCFALKFGLPFLAVTSNSHKVEAVISDIGLDPREHILSPDTHSQEMLDKRIRELDFWPEKTAAKIDDYVKKAQSAIPHMFREIADDISSA